MKSEIEAAVKWWADQLRTKPKHDNGDGMHNMMFALLQSNRTPIPESKITIFENELTKILTANFEKDWDPKNPGMGSYFRCVGVDYGPDGRLRDAAKIADINVDDYVFPVKTNMWIDPGEVKVSCGYRAPVETIYPRPT